VIRKRAVQRDMERIGSEGCYFLSLIVAVERELDSELDIYAVYLASLEAGAIGEDCYVYEPQNILDTYLGGKWNVSKMPAAYFASEGDIVIMRYERKDGMKTWAHFVLADRSGAKVEYDPYGTSKTVSDGQLVSKRVLRRI